LIALWGLNSTAYDDFDVQLLTLIFCYLLLMSSRM